LQRNPTREGNAIKRESVFQPEFLEDLKYWVETDRRVTVKVLELVDAILRDPVKGIGKPERLKYLGPGVWSRRITQEHRVVYLVSKDRIDFLQCRYHYR
jgi:toxin YoeB